MNLIRILIGIMLTAFLLTAAGEVSDDRIYDEVRLKLSADREVRGAAIEVKVSDGIVELSGKVRTEKARSRAEKVTKKVKGVQKVINKLTVPAT